MGTHSQSDQRDRAAPAPRTRAGRRSAPDVPDRVPILEAAQRFQAVFQGARDAIFLADPDTGILIDVNEQGERLVKRTRAELIGACQTLLHPQDDAAHYAEVFRRHIEAGGRPHERLDVVTSDGQRIPVEISGSVVELAGGRRLAIGVFRDMREPLEAERALRDREAKLRSIFRAAPVGIGVALHGTFVEVNQQICEMSGYAVEELVGRPIRMLHPADGTFEPVHGAMFRQLREQGSGIVEARWRRKDGTTLDVLVSAAPIDPNDLARGTTFVAVDISARKRTEAALCESEARYRSMMDAMDDLVYICSRDLRVEYMNQTLIQRTGRNAVGEPCFRALYDLDRVCPWCANGSIQEGASRRFEMTSPKDGRTYYVSNTPLFHADGTISNMAVLRDVTDLRRAEEDRRRLEAHIERTQRLESLGMLAGGIAHDFNNLLTAIIGHINLSRAHLPPRSPAQDNLHAADAAAQRAADLCKQMLAYSGKGRFAVEALDLNEVVAHMVHMLEVLIPRRTAIKYRFTPGLPAVEADAGQIHQVIMNLIINAVEAIGDREGEIVLSTGLRACDRAFLAGMYLDDHLPEGPYVHLEVADNGCGMDSATARRIFDPFFSTKFTGRGLGLPVVLGIVRGHKGAINVASTPGKGATFTVLLPAAARQAAAGARRGRAAPGWRGHGSVLVVDDDEMILGVAKPMLERLGFSMLAASGGNEAIEIFRAHRDEIRCVILDLMMPQKDGGETFAELRSIKEDVRVILSSGYDEEEVAARFAQADLAGFLQKPYTLKSLETAMRRATEE